MKLEHINLLVHRINEIDEIQAIQDSIDRMTGYAIMPMISIILVLLVVLILLKPILRLIDKYGYVFYGINFKSIFYEVVITVLIFYLIFH